MVSIVICSTDEARFAALGAHYSGLLAGRSYELIRVADAKSMSEGYNRGFAAAKGELVVFSQDHVEILTPRFYEILTGHLETNDVIGVAGTDRLLGPGWPIAGPPYIFGQVAQAQADRASMIVCLFSAPRRLIRGMQALDGLFLAFRREVIEKLGGWDQVTFTGSHCYDLDMVFRAHQAGYRVAVACDLPILYSPRTDTGPVSAGDIERFMAKHAGNLAVGLPRRYRFTAVPVTSREQAVQMMTPPYWDRKS